MKQIVQLLVNALAVVLIANLLPGVAVASLGTAVWVALILSILNLLVKPILIVLTLPITVLTLGLFLLIINAIIISMADALISGFTVNGIGIAILFSLLLSVLESVLSVLFGLKE
ncbi:phage holin family protein [Wenyingzhuangia marina]|uniref:Putative membrane protein n=1 Tax=Wenyingzhuangia marina TaxID=1195760 RepID=A0A1M5V9N8_9FLAO|nr:phage holin family protein [Wenyingzhuangia marina]GGF73456.1 membrane protein [Wenyingzhuangia marina]SHH71982.1 putative membrane protein [Wenyingzhuangia marina]